MAKDMMKAIIAAAVLGLVFAVAGASPASAADRTFVLFGSETGGWGSTATSQTTPGPTLTVNAGDNVTLRLNATDGQNHNWFLDYDADGNDDANEPNSPNFRDTEIVWNFTADQEGTHTYRCRFHPDMQGNLVVLAAGTPPNPPAGGETAILVVAAVVAVFAAAIAVASLIAKRKGISERRNP